MPPHPPLPAPNIPPRLLLRILGHVALELVHLALFGLHARNPDSFGHLPAYGFGLVGGGHGWVGFFVGGGWVCGLFVVGVNVQDLGEDWRGLPG